MLWEELEEKRGLLEWGILLINLLVMRKDKRRKQRNKQTLKAAIT